MAAPRPRRYLARRWIVLIRPFLRYSNWRHAYVLRGVGERLGPVLREDRRARARGHFDGTDRRGSASVA